MKALLAIIATAAAGLFVTLGWARSASVGITITARVEPFAEWAESSDVVVETDWPGPMNQVSQSRVISKPIVLYTNTDAVITARPGANNGVLTSGSQTLRTAFKITGSVASPDGSFKSAGSGPGEFFNSQNSYTIYHQTGTGACTINLVTQATSPKDSAPEPGLYTCGIVLTAQW